MKNTKTINWREVAMILAKNTEMSRRQIAKTIDVPRSTVLDYLRKHLK